MRRWIFGELGVLDAVFLSHLTINKVCLIISEGDNCYLGTLMFEKADSAKAVFEFLYQQIGKSLTTIGAIDLPESFCQ